MTTLIGLQESERHKGTLVLNHMTMILHLARAIAVLPYFTMVPQRQYTFSVERMSEIIVFLGLPSHLNYMEILEIRGFILKGFELGTTLS